MDLSKYIGIPYEKYDCWQFICYVYRKELGIRLPGFNGEYESGYDTKKIDYLYTREMAKKIWPQVEIAKWPDLAVFCIDGDKWHAGIIVGNDKMLHTQEKCNSVIERYTNIRWKNRLYGFYRYAG